MSKDNCILANQNLSIHIKIISAYYTKSKESIATYIVWKISLAMNTVKTMIVILCRVQTKANIW